MNNALKFLLLAAACALVVLLITKGVDVARKGQEDTEGNLDQYSQIAGDYESMELEVYDKIKVNGSEIKSLIEEWSKDDYLSIKVINGRPNTEDYIHASTIASNVATIGEADTTAISALPSADNYINDGGVFYCEAFYDANNVLACLRFTQQ